MAERKRNQDKPAKKREAKDAQERAQDLDVPEEKARNVKAGKYQYSDARLKGRVRAL